jgi:hypothetical protein
MGQVCQCWWRICLEINVFSRFEYYMLYVLYSFMTYLLTLPCTWDEVTGPVLSVVTENGINVL